VTDTATAARRAPARWPPALRGHADRPAGKRTGRKSPCDQTFGHATGCGVSADPSGSAPLRGAAPVGSAGSSSPRRRGDRAKVACRAKGTRNFHQFAGGTGSGPQRIPEARCTHLALRRGGGRDSGRPEARRTSAPAGKEADPHKAKPKGASGSGSRQRGSAATDFTADQHLEADGPHRQSRARRTARETTSTGGNGRDQNGGKVCTAVARNLDRPRHPDRPNPDPGKDPDGRRDRRDRLTRHSCRGGESSEGWSVTGTAQEARARFRTPDRRARVLWSPGAPRTAPDQQEFLQGNARWTRPALAGAGQGVRPSPQRPETWRTPWSVPGCNKPGRCRAEQAVEAGRNGKGGTSSEGGISEPKAERRQPQVLRNPPDGSS